MKIVFITVLLTTMVSCTNDFAFKNGKINLEQQGYKNVENTGYAIFCCGQDDMSSTGFKAVNINGDTVRGCFCGGIGKGFTIRFR